jgi:prepilin-type N-terminal cleavage/methylation domain-containing protein
VYFGPRVKLCPHTYLHYNRHIWSCHLTRRASRLAVFLCNPTSKARVHSFRSMRTCNDGCVSVQPPSQRQGATEVLLSGAITVSKQSRSRGFTLMELTVTLLIVGIASTAAIPLLQQSMENRNLNIASQRILSELQSLRNTAQLENRRIRVTPIQNKFAFTISRLNPAGNILSTSVLDLSQTSTPIASFRLFVGPQDTHIEFNHLGEVSPPIPGRFSNAACIAQITLSSGSSTTILDISSNLNRL